MIILIKFCNLFKALERIFKVKIILFLKFFEILGKFVQIIDAKIQYQIAALSFRKA